MHRRGRYPQRPSDGRLQEHPGARCSQDWAVEGWLAPGCAPGPGTEGRGGTFLKELAPALGPVGELLCIGFLDLGALLHTAHQVVAQPVPVIDALHCPLVVPHLAAEQRARLPRAPAPPHPPPGRPPSLAAASCRRRSARPPGPPRSNALGVRALPLWEARTPRLTPHRLDSLRPALNRISWLSPSAEEYL